MEIRGRIRNGVVVIEGDEAPPEGAAVRISYPCEPPKPVIVKEPGQLPVVRGGVPGSVRLTNERVQEILDGEDIETLKRQRNASS